MSQLIFIRNEQLRSGAGDFVGPRHRLGGTDTPLHCTRLASQQGFSQGSMLLAAERGVLSISDSAGTAVVTEHGTCDPG
jgi:hypothetical protein